ncbi:unnamed protein product, partial [Allacma fusca]
FTQSTGTFSWCCFGVIGDIWDVFDTGRFDHYHGRHSNTWMQQQKSAAVKYLDNLH